MEREKMFCGSGEAAAYLQISKVTLKSFEEYGYLKPDLVVGSGHRRYLWDNVISFRKKCELKEIPDGAALMSAKDVCSYLGISDYVLRQLEESSRLIPCLVLPPRNRRFYLPDDVDEYLVGVREKSG